MMYRARRISLGGMVLLMTFIAIAAITSLRGRTAVYAQPVYPPPASLAITTAAGTVTGTCTTCAAGVTFTASVQTQGPNSVTVAFTASNGAASAGKQVQLCLGSQCQTVTLGASGSATTTFTAGVNASPASVQSVQQQAAAAVPVASGAQAPRRAAAAVVVSGAQAPRPVAGIALPNTGAGGVAAARSGYDGREMAGIGLAVTALVAMSGVAAARQRRPQR